MKQLKRKDLEVSGNILASGALVAREMERGGLAIHQIEEMSLLWIEHDVTIKRISFACKFGPDGDWLGVISADGVDGPIVAFVSGPSFVHVIRSMGSAMRNGSLKWKEDSYAK